MKKPPLTINELMNGTWLDIEPYYQELLRSSVTSSNIQSWLTDWSNLRKIVDETYARLQLANAQDTANVKAEESYHRFLSDVYPHIQASDQLLKEKLLRSKLQPSGMEIPLRNMSAEAEIFSNDNLPLLTKERKLGSTYNKIIGTQTVNWDGEELTLTQLSARANSPDRALREKAWRLAAKRRLQDRQAINDLWTKLIDLRQGIAKNAGAPDYRAYQWKQLHRFDYTPEDCKQFQNAIEKVVVPAATQIYEKHCHRMNIDRLRPWDLQNDLSTMRFPNIVPYKTTQEFIDTTSRIFHQVHPKLGRYFDKMRQDKLLDLENRKGKGPGGFCTSFATQGVPFIFMNAVGMETDVRVLLHESGHAFHVFERAHLPFHHQWRAGMEFNEVASTAMELLPSLYISEEHGGFFNNRNAARFQIQQLESKLVFWPYMAIVDAFQHWVYLHPDLARIPSNCDAKWSELSDRFMPRINWDGLEDVKATGWHRKLHIHRYPFYYIEYGLSLLGAIQIWNNALVNQTNAINKYLDALALGGTASITDLYATAGAKLAFNKDTLSEAVTLIVKTIDELEAIS